MNVESKLYKVRYSHGVGYTITNKESGESVYASVINEYLILHATERQFDKYFRELFN